MRTVLALTALALLSGCDQAPFASNGRYSISTSGQDTVLLDNLSGKTWFLIQASQPGAAPSWLEMRRNAPLPNGFTPSVGRPSIRKLTDQEVEIDKKVMAEIARRKAAASSANQNSN